MAQICLYHGNDLDGVCSAAIVKLKNPDVMLFPVDYDGSYDFKKIINKGDEVIMLDYVTNKFSDMEIINDHCDFTWIDHHTSAILDYSEHIVRGGKTIKGVREQGKATCELTWEFLHPNTQIPYPIWLLGRYDVRDFFIAPSILPFQYGMKVDFHPPDSLIWWSNLINESRDSDLIQGIIRNGKTIMRYRETLNRKICEMQAFESEIFVDGCIYKTICVNRALCGASVFQSMYDPSKHDIMVVYYICKRGAWNVSLYSDKKEIDVSEIAKFYGGGGDVGAAGFRCSLLPFEITR